VYLSCSSIVSSARLVSEVPGSVREKSWKLPVRVSESGVFEDREELECVKRCATLRELDSNCVLSRIR
jgi:hypothetical protein